MSRLTPAVGLALLALASAGCGGAGAGAGGGGSNVAAVTQAAYVTGQAPGYRFDLTSTTTVGGQSVTVQGSGSIDERNPQGSMSMQIEGRTIAEIIKSPYVYIKVPTAGAATVAHGKPWVRADLDALGQAAGGGSPLTGSSNSPTQVLRFLKATGQVQTLPGQRLRGVPTTHYRATVDLDRYAAAVAPSQRAAARQSVETLKRVTGGSTLPIDVWIDRQHRVRRLSFSLAICSPQGKLQESLSMDLFGYGRQPTVAAPPSSQVTDISAQLNSDVAKSLQQLHC
jgi:hypothetical protein